MKKCSICKIAKEFSEFTKHNKQKDGLDYLCKSCKRIKNKAARLKNIEVYNSTRRRYHAENKEKISLAHKRRHIEIRSIVYNAYGNSCKCCGESGVTFLTLDHVNNDGAQHRREIGTGKGRGAGTRTLYWAIKNNFPNVLQLLCANCNTSKARNNGTCAHKSLNN